MQLHQRAGKLVSNLTICQGTRQLTSWHPFKFISPTPYSPYFSYFVLKFCCYNASIEQPLSTTINRKKLKSWMLAFSFSKTNGRTGGDADKVWGLDCDRRGTIKWNKKISIFGISRFPKMNFKAYLLRAALAFTTWTAADKYRNSFERRTDSQHYL